MLFRFARALGAALGALMMVTALSYAPVASAAMVGTGSALEATPGEAASGDARRARLRALLSREAAAEQLERLGVDPEEVRARVHALSDAEVARLTDRIDAMPAGGLNDDHLIVLLLLIIILLLAL
ncbi:MAG: PA2779 family protein [Gammaproteobacteria bacterium]|nr:PA2779 family protein [Gammaproteobacteria bacterium]